MRYFSFFIFYICIISINADYEIEYEGKNYTCNHHFFYTDDDGILNQIQEAYVRSNSSRIRVHLSIMSDNYHTWIKIYSPDGPKIYTNINKKNGNPVCERKYFLHSNNDPLGRKYKGCFYGFYRNKPSHFVDEDLNMSKGTYFGAFDCERPSVAEIEYVIEVPLKRFVQTCLYIKSFESITYSPTRLNCIHFAFGVHKRLIGEVINLDSRWNPADVVNWIRKFSNSKNYTEFISLIFDVSIKQIDPKYFGDPMGQLSTVSTLDSIYYVDDLNKKVIKGSLRDGIRQFVNAYLNKNQSRDRLVSYRERMFGFGIKYVVKNANEVNTWVIEERLFKENKDIRLNGEFIVVNKPYMDALQVYLRHHRAMAKDEENTSSTSGSYQGSYYPFFLRYIFEE